MKRVNQHPNKQQEHQPTLKVPPRPPPPPPPMNGISRGGGGGGAAFVKVMTDEQMETLRKQIAAYVTICEQLEKLYRSMTSSHHNPGPDYRINTPHFNPYCAAAAPSSVTLASTHIHHNQYYYPQPKIPRRQRWNPTPKQLELLELVFDQGNEAPSKEKIKNLTYELEKYGQIAEANVYNWFQNRRARFKKRQSTTSAISESEGEMGSTETTSKSTGEDQNLE